MIQCDYTPYNVNTISWVKCLKNDMDNIYSYCKDMFDDANRMLLEFPINDATNTTTARDTTTSRVTMKDLKYCLSVGAVILSWCVLFCLTKLSILR